MVRDKSVRPLVNSRFDAHIHRQLETLDKRYDGASSDLNQLTLARKPPIDFAGASSQDENWRFGNGVGLLHEAVAASCSVPCTQERERQ